MISSLLSLDFVHRQALHFYCEMQLNPTLIDFVDAACLW